MTFVRRKAPTLCFIIREIICPFNTNVKSANFSTKYFILSNGYTIEDGINSYTMFFSTVQEIVHELKLVDYLLAQEDKL